MKLLNMRFSLYIIAILAMNIYIGPLYALSQTKDEVIQGFLKAQKPGAALQYQMKYVFNHEAIGTTKEDIEVSEKFVPSDTTIGGYYNFTNNENGNIYIYNGFECIRYMPDYFSSDSAFAHNKRDHNEVFSDQEIKIGDIKGFRPSVVTSSYYYELSLLGIKNGLADSSSYSEFHGISLLSDTVINGKECYRLGSPSVTLALDKKTYLPAYLIIKNQTQSLEAVYANYKYNPPKSDRLFSRKAFPKGLKFAENVESNHHFLKPGAEAPDFEATALSGKRIRISELRGAPVLLMFTETYCPGCLLSYPNINAIAKEYKGVKVIGIYPNDAKSTFEEFEKKKKTEFDIFRDVNKEYKKYGVSGYPTFFLVDKNGKIVYSSLGYSENAMKEIRKAIEKELNGNM